MSRQRLILATGNPHKVEEFSDLLHGLKLDVVPASVCGGMPEVEETGNTFAANARLKAAALRAWAPFEDWVVADDSGIEVDALGGAPGLFSARYAGPNADDAANVKKLLKALSDVAPGDRSARFRCVLCLLKGDGAEHFFEGVCEGAIAGSVRGRAGFGYDPVFIPEGFDRSFAELGEALKGELSHRARAVQALREGLSS